MTDPQVEAARRESIAARARLLTRLEIAKARLSPQAMARRAAEGAKARASRFALDQVDTLRRRPAVVAALAAAIGVIFAGRPTLAKLARGALDAVQPSRRPRVASSKRPLAHNKDSDDA